MKKTISIICAILLVTSIFAGCQKRAHVEVEREHTPTPMPTPTMQIQESPAVTVLPEETPIEEVPTTEIPTEETVVPKA